MPGFSRNCSAHFLLLSCCACLLLKLALKVVCLVCRDWKLCATLGSQAVNKLESNVWVLQLPNDAQERNLDFLSI